MRKLLAVLLFFYVCLQLPRLGAPPLMRESWRETDGLMVARNFCRDDASILYPRIDARGSGSGITGMEFPLVNFLAAEVACDGPELVWVARSSTLLCTIAAALCVYALGKRRLSAISALIATAAFLFAPIVFYYGRTAQPDMAATACTLLALLLLLRAVERTNVQWLPYYASALCMALAILLKSPAILLGLPLLVVVVAKRRPWRSLSEALKLVLYAPIALIPALLWYRHALQLQAQSGLHHFMLTRSWEQVTGDLSQWAMYRRFFGAFFDAYAGPAVAIAAIAALRRWRTIDAWLLAALATFPLYITLTGWSGARHFYYGLPFVAPLALLATHAIAPVLQRWRTAQQAAVCAVLIAVMAVYALVRTQGWFQTTVEERDLSATRAWLDQAAPDTPVVLFSQNDPTFFWFLDRHGWLTMDATQAPAAHHVAVIDDRRFANGERDMLEKALTAAGYREQHRRGRVAVWQRALVPS